MMDKIMKFFSSMMEKIADRFPSYKEKLIGLFSSRYFKIVAAVLCALLVIGLVRCSVNTDKEEATPPTEPSEIATEASTEAPTEAPTEPPVAATMGTVTAGELNIRKGPESGYESVGTYLKGERIEILETTTVDGTVWGRTSLGWVGMGYVRMDGTAPDSGEEDPNAPNLVSDGSLRILGYGVVNLGELNVRYGPGKEYGKAGTVTMGTRYACYQLADGWARIEDGWVSTEYFYMEGSTADNAITGTVTTDDLNIRTGPDTSFQSVGTLKKGESVHILAQVDRWGYTEKGWVSMIYIEEVEPTYTTGTGTVTSGLNIRKDPNADSDIVGTYTLGDTVTITEVQGAWGKTDQGWINLHYVEFN